MASVTNLSGLSLIGFREGAGTGQPLYASDPSTGQRLQPGLVPATPEEVELAVRLAAEAFPGLSPWLRARPWRINDYDDDRDLLKTERVCNGQRTWTVAEAKARFSEII